MYAKESSTAGEILDMAVEKHRTFAENTEIQLYDNFKLLFKGGSEVVLIPGTNKPFTLGEYKKASGFNYGDLRFYITPVGKQHWFLVGTELLSISVWVDYQENN